MNILVELLHFWVYGRFPRSDEEIRADWCRLYEVDTVDELKEKLKR